MILPLAIGEGAAAVTFGDRDHAARKSPSDAEAVVIRQRKVAPRKIVLFETIVPGREKNLIVLIVLLLLLTLVLPLLLSRDFAIHLIGEEIKNLLAILRDRGRVGDACEQCQQKQAMKDIVHGARFE